MSDSLPNRRSIRLPGYDYSQNGAYFVTICTQNRECLFGDIVGNEMKLNELGNIVNNQWKNLSIKFKNIELDIYCIMPNHFHGIITINKLLHGGRENLAPTLGNIVALFKYQTTKQFNSVVGAWSSRPIYPKIWQRNYYEHIIRDDGDLNRVREYIIDNPLNWKNDDMFM